MSLLRTSDKFFWHKYVDFYEAFFENKNFKTIAEIGIFKGNSIRWLLERFPSAYVYGADILPMQPEWPIDNRFSFTQLDQGNVVDLRKFLNQEKFDLIIEDGSHIPAHQALCLIEGIKVLSPNGMYILEDIHTSHPGYALRKSSIFSKISSKYKFKGNALTVLLAIEHYKKIGVDISFIEAEMIARDAIISAADILLLGKR
jgi:trans-aconitate methyltransferase